MFESPILYILISLLILILISNAATTKQEMSILYSRITIQGLLLTAFIAYSNLYLNPLEKGLGIYNGLFNINVFTQSFNIFIIILVSIISILTAFYPRKILSPLNDLGFKSEFFYNKNSRQYTIIEYALITIFVLSGAIFLMSTGDLVSLFLSIELQSYGLYILATLYRNSESATNSGLTYFLLGGLSSCFILLGSAILYVSSGTTNLDNVYIINSINEYGLYTNIYSDMINETMLLFSSTEINNLNISNYINFSLIILAVGFLFKISAAPFHFWSPDVYDGIPTIVTTFVAIIAKISIFTIMLELVSYTDLRSLNIVNNLHDIINTPVAETINMGYLEINFINWKNILIFSSLMSLIIGSVLGLTQYRIKRLFAYSTISHVGFILLALCINRMESIQGYVFYILQYSLSNLNAFFILITIGYTLYKYAYLSKSEGELKISTINEFKYSTNSSNNKLIDVENSPIQLLNQLKGYFYINSYLAISFSITIFSFVGIPPLIGFFAKQMVLSAALDQGYIFMTLVGVITSVIGAVYYLNIVKLIFFNKSDYIQYNGNKQVKFCVNDGLSVTISILTMIILLFLFVPGEWFRIVSIISLPLYNN